MALMIDVYKGSLPARYKEVLTDSLRWPEPLKDIMPDLDPPSRVALLAAYDFFNDKVLQAGGNATISMPTNVATLTAEFIHGLEQLWPIESHDDIEHFIDPIVSDNQYSDNIIVENSSWGQAETLAILKPCLSEAPKITLYDIRKFRKEYRSEFVRSLASIYAEVSEIHDHMKRINACEQLAKQYLEGSWFAYGMQRSLATALNLCTFGCATEECKEIANMFVNKIGKRVPLFRDRWVYWFKDRKGYKFGKGIIN